MYDIITGIVFGGQVSSVADVTLFKGNLNFIMDKLRGQFAEKSLDFIQYLILNIQEHKKHIIQQLQIEDLIPASMQSRLPKEFKKFLLAQAEKILHILREVFIQKLE